MINLQRNSGKGNYLNCKHKYFILRYKLMMLAIGAFLIFQKQEITTITF